MEWKKVATQDITQVFIEQKSDQTGLSSDVAEERVFLCGKNTIPEKSNSFSGILKRRLHSSFLYLLLGAAGLSFFLGDFIEAGLIFLFIFINIGLEMFQEYHGEHASRLLKKYLVVHTRVRRNGRILVVESEDVVPGDVVLIEAGDRLSADIRFITCSGLILDESVMTGESIAVRKQSARLSTPPTEMFEAKNIGFAGTVVTAGQGEGIVFATGEKTALGDIALLVKERKRETGFEKSIAHFSRFIIQFVLVTLVLIFFANIFIKGDGINIPELLIFSLVLAVSVIPEALPAIVTVALSRGALKLAQKKVIIKRLSAIEDLGSIEILCTDKTGTLTQNILSVSEIHAKDKRRCLLLSSLASLVTPSQKKDLHDAFDKALWESLSLEERTVAQTTRRIDIIPFDPDRRRNSVLVEIVPGKEEIIVRGAPEEILRLSQNVNSFAVQNALQWIKERGEKGERVLAVARRPFSLKQKYTLYEEQQLEFIGLISFVDPLKETAKDTLENARKLNVQVKILTGDSKEVAGAVGYAVGLLRKQEDVITGKELSVMGYGEKKRAILSHAVFARISPREKYEIIKILQEKYEVGFLGEGINDAPALQMSDVGLVVAGASDVARGSADVILLQKSLETVIDGIKEGRSIFANILKYLKITLTSNFGNFYSVAIASLFLPFIPLLPVQILLLDLLSDFPMIAIATDTVDAEELEKPKSYQMHSVVWMAMLFGVISSLFDLMLFGKFSHMDPAILQTAWFLLSITTEVVLIFSFRTRRPFFRSKKIPVLLTELSLAILAVAFFLPFSFLGQTIFLFSYPTKQMLIIVGFLVLGYFVMTEAIKYLYEKHFREYNRSRSTRFHEKRHFASKAL
ncbi:MAG: HAD-IC family P-type ATPase [Candidatus Moranbacteria bacterium]|nr:HAD-IC family P-type ATPase [Candidatus Moranbacteria bacterium]MDD3964487.1 HAD-IC family P-type ATPase [Candidatus Moranbacteria bacterium]